jgi:hypothetical protein
MANPAKSEAAPVAKTEYDLPNDSKIFTLRPTNKIRRLLANQPETHMRFFTEITAAASIAKIELPAGYNGETDADGKPVAARVVEFDQKSDAGEEWARLDVLSIRDSQAFVAAFSEMNVPTQEMIGQVVAAAKAGLEKGK